jgi:hypothetical protein
MGCQTLSYQYYCYGQRYPTERLPQISPLRLSFTGTLNVVRLAIPKFQRLEPEEIPFF